MPLDGSAKEAYDSWSETPGLCSPRGSNPTPLRLPSCTIGKRQRAWSQTMSAIAFQQAIPVLRIFDVAKAKEFYCGYLAFTVDWEHRFDDNSPVYMQVSRAGQLFHLSEHYGDACRGATVFIKMTGIRSYHAELTGKEYKFYRPCVEETFYEALCMEILDPFGNKLRFHEFLDKPQA
jgi:hypothetical protein